MVSESNQIDIEKEITRRALEGMVKGLYRKKINRLVAIGLFLVGVIGCEAGGGVTGPGGNLPSGKLYVSCMDFQPGGPCAATLISKNTTSAQITPGTVVETVFDLGGLSLSSDVAIGYATITNDTDTGKNVVFVAPVVVAGCGFNGFTLGVRAITSGGNADAQMGGLYCSGATPGKNSEEVRIYEGTAEQADYVLNYCAPDWNNMGESWDWSVVDADMSGWGLVPIAHGIMLFEYVE